MHVNPVITAAKHAQAPIALQRLSALLAPFTNIGSGLAAAPEVASVACIEGGAQLGVTHSAAYLAFLRCRSLESGAAYGASERGCASASPPRSLIASLRAEPIGVIRDAGRRAIERFTALLAYKVSTVFRLRWRLAHRWIVSLPTPNSPLNTAYTEMAMERVRADAPLFADLPPAADPEDERMADLFAGDEYQRVSEAASKPLQVPRGWDTGPGAHGTIHRTGRTLSEAAE